MASQKSFPSYNSRMLAVTSTVDTKSTNFCRFFEWKAREETVSAPGSICPLSRVSEGSSPLQARAESAWFPRRNSFTRESLQKLTSLKAQSNWLNSTASVRLSSSCPLAC